MGKALDVLNQHLGNVERYWMGHVQPANARPGQA
jgi:hypothetical protein